MPNPRHRSGSHTSASKIDDTEGLDALRRRVKDLEQANADQASDMVALREIEERYRELVEMSPDAVLVYAEDKIVFANSSAARLLGRPRPEDLVGIPVLEIVPPEDREEIRRRQRRIEASDGRQEYGEERFLRLDGSEVTAEVVAVRLRFGDRPAIQLVVRDITERKQRERALRESEARLKAILDNVPATIYLKDLAGRFVVVNRHFEERFQVSADQVRGAMAHDVGPKPLADAIVAQEAEALRARAPIEKEETWDLPEGERTYSVIKFPVLDSTGAIITMGGIETDITERKRAEEALRESEERFRAVVENAPAGIYLKDIEGRFLLVNKHNEKLHGISRDELRGKTVFDLLPEEIATEMAAHDAEVTRRDTTVEVEMQVQHRDGAVRSIVAIKFPIHGAGGGIVAIGGVDVDITERKAAEKALRESEAQLRLVADNIPVLIAYVDDERRYRFVNKTYEDWTLRSIDAVNGQYVWDVLGKQAYEALRPHIEMALSGETSHYEIEMTYPDGNLRQVEATYVPDFGNDGQVKGYFVLVIDITERKAAEDRFREVQKLEAVGQLTGGVAHDFNNLLAVIMGNAQLLETKLVDDQLRALLGSVIRATQRGGELTHRLLAFSRQQPLNALVINLGELCAGIVSMLRRTLGETIEIDVSSRGDLWNTVADPGQVENALLNLAINARDAMPGGGKLTIETMNAQSMPDDMPSDEGEKLGHYVMLQVSDTGTGMPAHVLELVFEPFFTTKEVGRGSGLGLSMIYGFAKQSGGYVTIESEEGRGTTVRLYLPKAEAAQDDVRQVATDEEMPRGHGEIILVVEDDPEVRGIAVAQLVGLGYETLQTEDGRAALELLATSSPIDLVLSDVVLPGGMSGPEMCTRARGRLPHLKYLFMSGYAVTPEGTLPEGVDLLSKPFEIAELAIKLRSALRA